MRSLTRSNGCARISRMGSLALLSTSLGLAILSTGPTVHAQLVITPTFDASITGASNAAAIEATINSAIAAYQTSFTNPINVTINFQAMGSGLGQSNTTLYKLNYSTFINALTANASSVDDATALAHLPTGSINPVNSTSTINVKTANIRALGIAGSFPPIGGFDGTIGLNTGITDIGITGTTGQYSLFAVTEHEIDEVLGLGSDVAGTGFFADPAPEDLYRYTSGGARTFSNAVDDAYLSLDGTTDLARYNNVNNGGDYGDYHTGGTPQVQDAFATPGAHPVLGVELRSLDAIGYTRTAAIVATPEPSSFVMLGAGALALSGYGLRRRKRAGKSAA
ncbi:MAG: hypothetical protein JWL77_1648 [Chthonomonadaceae bacterium]|nr:hypothetical protein [Chthonomonadaceae bacterium]